MGYWQTADDVRGILTAKAAATPAALLTCATFTATNSFAIIPLDTAGTDTAAAFNPTTHLYTIPTTGFYTVSSMLRVVDSVGSGIGVAVGVDTTTADGPTVAWYATSGAMRNSFVYSKTAHFTQGDQVRLFAYADAASLNFSTAALNLVLLA